MMLVAILGYYIWTWATDNDVADFAGVGCNDIGDGSSCAMSSTVVRMSFTLAIFHLIMLLAILPRGKCSAMLHDGFFSLKFLLVVGGFIGTLWIPNDPVMNGYMEMSKWVSIMFLSYQAILILIMAYVINNTLVDNMK